jgi:hypothetical protein
MLENSVVRVQSLMLIKSTKGFSACIQRSLLFSKLLTVLLHRINNIRHNNANVVLGEASTYDTYRSIC